MPTSPLSHRMIRSPLFRFVAATLLVSGLAACNDPFGLKATVAVQYDTLSAYAVTGTPLTFPAGYNAGTGIVVRVEPDIAFDIAFDLDASGKIKLIPARQISPSRNVGGFPSASPRVGLLRHTGTFESLTKAPGPGAYTYDSTIVVSPGEAVALEVSSDACQFSLSQLLYAKLVIDSTNAQTRRIFFRATRDPNCGFRSLTPGVPKS